MADEATQMGVASLGQGVGRAAFVLWLVKPDLHELVLEQRSRDGGDHAGRHPSGAHQHEGAARLHEAAEMAALQAGEGLGARHGAEHRRG